MSKITVVGSLNIDLVVRAPRFPGPGETIAGHDFHTIPGGKGANQAVAAARQGADVSMVGRVGDDAFGQRLRETLRQDGVDTRHVTADPQAPTGVAVIAVDEAGENRIILAAGANGRVSPADVNAATSAIAQADVLVLQLEVPLPAVMRAIEVARENRVAVILNPAPAQPLPTELLASIDYLIPNESEAALLADSDASRPEQAAQALRSAGVRSVIVTLGEQGALLVDSTRNRSVSGFAVSVVDTTAAGDAFVGAFAVALAEGQSAMAAVRWANAAGALATTVLGAQPSLPTHAAVAEFVAQQETEATE
ncbi:MAG: ribokinase [Anaerolineae bacterium]